jgi:hypothetical protein
MLFFKNTLKGNIMMNIKSFSSMAAFAVICGVYAACPDPDMIEKVKRGEVDCVKVSWFGFDAEDSTRHVQAALDSKARKVVIDRMPQGVWIVRPLFLRKSGKEIVFEDGAELVAKRGEYRSGSDSLLTLKRVKDVVIRGKGTIRMWHDDYLKPPYPLAEWRHGISATSVENLTLDGITVRDSGGDGLYIGVAGSDHIPCRNITVRNCVFDRNSRQGISVISVDGLTVENTLLNNTIGRPPQAGIDFEPNHIAHMFKRCVLRGCEISGNKGSGIEVYLVNFNAESDPVDIRVENCRISGNSCSFRYWVDLGGISNPFDDGTVVFDGCTMERGKHYAVFVKRRRFANGKTIFRNCRIVDACTANPTNADVRAEMKGFIGAAPECIVFDNVSIKQPVKRQWISIESEKVFDGVPTVISGRVEIESPEGKSVEILDKNWYNARPSYKSRPKFPDRVQSDLSAVTVYDARPGEMERFDPIFIRGRNKFYHVFYADSARTVRFRGIQMKVGKRDASKIPLYFHGMKEWKILNQAPMPGFEESEFSFNAPAAGFYRMSVDTKGNGFAMTASDAPVALNVCRENVALVSSVGSLYFNVPENANATCLISGESIKERCGLEIYNQQGTRIYGNPDISAPTRIEFPSENIHRRFILKLMPPVNGVYEDVYLGVSGAPGFLFLGAGKYWK